MSSIYDWALDASANGNSDNIIDWQEGQPPSTVNNSARAMMQRIAEYILDNTAIKAGGNQEIITAQIKSPITAIRDGQSIKIIASYNNSANTKLNLNNTGAKPIYRNGRDTIIPLNGGEMLAGAVYEMVFSSSLNGGVGGWFLNSQTAQPKYVPSGIICQFAVATPPIGWLECNGQAISRETYSDLYAVIGTRWGEGNKTTTFNVPDLRGEFIRGWDDGRGIDNGRQFGSFQDSDNKKHGHTASCSEAGSHTHPYALYTKTASHGSGDYWNMLTKDYGQTIWDTQPAGTHTHTIKVDDSGGGESRPRNIALMYVIKV